MKFEIKILFGIAVVTSISYSIINAFFAPIVIQKNVDESTLGMIISMFPFVIILITPFISYFVETFGRKFLFVNSLLSQVIRIPFLYQKFLIEKILVMKKKVIYRKNFNFFYFCCCCFSDQGPIIKLLDLIYY